MLHKLSPIFSKTGSLFKCFQTENSSYSCKEIHASSYMRRDTDTSEPAHLMRQTRACRTEIQRTKIMKMKTVFKKKKKKKKKHSHPTQFPISLCPINLKEQDIITKCFQDVVKQRNNSILLVLRYCLTFKSDICYPRQLSSWPTRYQKPLNDFGMKSNTINLTPFKELTKTIRGK